MRGCPRWLWPCGHASRSCRCGNVSRTVAGWAWQARQPHSQVRLYATDPPGPPPTHLTPQGCLNELDNCAAQAMAPGPRPSTAYPPAALPPLRLVASLLEGGLLLACPSLLHQGGSAGSWFGQLLDDSLPDALLDNSLLATARLCPALGSEGRARLAPHVLAAAPLVLWGMAGRAHPVSCCAPNCAGCGRAPHANPYMCCADAIWALCAMLRLLLCRLWSRKG
jgi:hypothetical protein